MTRAEIVCRVALEEWSRVVKEPPLRGSDRIDEYIRSANTGLGLAWHWVKRYVRDRDFEWCGAFAAFCYGSAGLSKAVRVRDFASTYRLWRFSGGGTPNARRIAPVDLRPGDVVVVGPRESRFGSHICIATEPLWAAGVCHTVEGNAGGRLGDGAAGQGVVKQTRYFSPSDRTARAILYGVRPLEEDYDP